jgi:hypothetical protein
MSFSLSLSAQPKSEGSNFWYVLVMMTMEDDFYIMEKF